MDLSPEEQAVEKLLDSEGLLHDMDKGHFHGKEDVFVVCCPDGRHFVRSIVNPFMEMYEKAHKIQFHPIPRHGGTLLLDECSPLILPGHTTDKDLICDIKFAVKNGYKAGCLINHFPCSMARDHNVRPLHIIDSLMHAKDRIKKKEGISDITVACFLQITDGERRRISHIRCSDFLSWRARYGDTIHGALEQMASSLR
ncbi:hypothetical protein A3C91_02470 [Candidatus Azambacteria bacterium RIFCSPHIGHO2_02_FULL_52_12]|uniref:Uncharacterized protein n=1 Tax=Candidatus Azambacteria bacterium RIFCSPLOWO2_01_FULL_46_25 TaxID=1797298 RepID=A0A1F5BVR6_9BACT|nr:MAG: hypothetical protein A3C91_02470 [Candidatus Azambacteria bacterium RIFCSPHIGHO2_02_FULL_52_12]OGD34686.1 MAG: hypothetical protein A2988_04265 [Candidatus Azambacteria bacterium RIFCSPLOWO2_01_FULL_46_25]OGD37456.1 MAG: hypothetical protein A2850_02695 [Candidatus Azambacteria bacterium RIFCSPHIGHO2_01_FULL_51_74]